MMYNFHTGYYRNGEPQLSFRNIAIHYMRHWFLIDLCMVIMDWMTLGLGPSSRAEDFRYISSIRTLRLLRSIRILRLLKLRRMLEALEDRIQSESLHIFL